MPSVLRPFDEVGDDEEVAGKLHLLDDRQLEFEPAVVIFKRLAGRGAMGVEPRFQAGDGLAAQFGGLVGPFSEIRQDRRARFRAKGAAQRDFHAVAGGLGEVGEFFQHFRAGGEAVLGREFPAVVVGDQRALGDAQQGVVGVVIRARREIGLVGRNQRQVAAVGEVEQRRLDPFFAFRPVALQFDIEPLRENFGKRV